MSLLYRRGILCAAAVLCAACLLTLCACSKTRAPEITEDGAECVARLSAVGDILVSDAQMKDALQTDGSYDFSSAFASISDDLSAADLTVGNLEGNFCGAPYDPSVCNYPDALATGLSAAGFDILQTANTCTITNGLAGLKSTKSTIEGAGMDAVGSFVSSDDREENGVLIRVINGVRIAFIAFTKGVGNVRLPDGTDYCVNMLYKDYDTSYSEVNTDAIVSCVEEAMLKKPDVVIALVHWGSEYDSEISDTQSEIESLLFDNGVDVILGTHSHLVGKMEKRQITTLDGVKKTVFVAYSLGNFYCDSSDSDTQVSVILNLEFTKYNTGETEITDVSYTPLYISDNGEEAADRFTILNVDRSVSLYESNYYDKVSKELYRKLIAISAELAEQTGSDLERKN